MTAFGTVLAALVLLTALLSDLFVAPVLAERTRRGLAAGEPDARVHLHRLIIGFGWTFAAVALGVLLLGGLSLREIGFTGADLSGSGVQPLLLGMLGGALAPLVLPRRHQPQRVIGDVGLLLPVTRQERKSYAAASVTAGITEEITYRALPILLFLHLLPGHNRLLVVVGSAVLFGLAHRYQGWAGMALTGVIGLVLGGLYVLSGSLWPSMLVHVLLDLRLLFMRRDPAPRAS